VTSPEPATPPTVAGGATGRSTGATVLTVQPRLVEQATLAGQLGGHRFGVVAAGEDERNPLCVAVEPTHMEWKLFADLAETAGGKTVAVEDDAETVGEALDALLSAHPELERQLLDDDGAVREHVNVLHDGGNLGEDGLATPVEDGDELALFPPVSGG